MNLVVLTAALSSLSSGLYVTGRILRSRKRTAGCGADVVLPASAFEIILNFSAVAIVGTWSLIMISHLRFVAKTKTGEIARPSFRLPGSPYAPIFTVLLLGAVLVLMWFDGTAGRVTLLCVPVLIVAFVVGWQAVRKRVRNDA
jgi:L-asparagine permease